MPYHVIKSHDVQGIEELVELHLVALDFLQAGTRIVQVSGGMEGR